MSQVGILTPDTFQSKLKPPLLRGKVESVEVTELDGTAALIKIKLKMELINTGSDPLILLQKDPLFVGAALAKSPDALARGEFLVTDYAGPAVDLSSEWVALRASLDKVSPPPDQTLLLRPNDSRLLEASVGISVPTKPGVNISFSKKESLQTIQKLSPIWLRVVCEAWPRNIEPGADRSKLKFGRKLRSRWRGYGVLWLDDIYSEPIRLDLNSNKS